MTKDEIKLIVEQSFNSSHEYSEDDVIDIKYIEINSISYVIYIRYNLSSWPLVFLLNLSNKKVIEIDHGLRGGPRDIKSENGYILMQGKLLGQGDGNLWYKYDIEISHLIGLA